MVFFFVLFSMFEMFWIVKEIEWSKIVCLLFRCSLLLVVFHQILKIELKHKLTFEYWNDKSMMCDVFAFPFALLPRHHIYDLSQHEIVFKSIPSASQSHFTILFQFFFILLVFISILFVCYLFIWFSLCIHTIIHDSNANAYYWKLIQPLLFCSNARLIFVVMIILLCRISECWYATYLYNCMKTLSHSNS